MLIRSLARPIGAMLALSLLAACGGDAGEAPEPAETGAPATTPPPATDAAATPSAPGAEPAAGGASTALVEEGRQVFNGAGICMTCHGPTAEGTPLAPDLTDDVWLWIDGNQPLEPQIVQVIREGVPTPREHPAPMPPMGGASLNDQQINALAAYIASFH